MFLIFINLLSWIILPFYFVIVLLSAIFLSSDFKIMEKFFPRNEGKDLSKQTIWIHAAGLGEITSVSPIVQFFRDKKDQYQLLISSCTKESQNYIAKNYSDIAIAHYLPYENKFIIRIFLKLWKPVLTIFLESEIWPLTIIETEKESKIILINARMSDKSFHTRSIFKESFSEVLAKFSSISVQSEEDYHKFAYFVTPEKITIFENLKFYSAKLKSEQKIVTQLEKLKSSRKTLVAASTYPEEENLLFSESLKDYFLIIAPRRIDRIKDIKALLTDRNYCLLSELNEIKEKCDIVVVDSYGNLGNCFEVADVVFVGGSIEENIGGHNPIEPMKFGKPIIMGPHYFKCKELVEQLKDQSILTIAEKNNFIDHVNDLMNNDAKRMQISEISQKLNDQKNKKFNEYIDLINKFLDN